MASMPEPTEAKADDRQTQQRDVKAPSGDNGQEEAAAAARSSSARSTSPTKEEKEQGQRQEPRSAANEQEGRADAKEDAQETGDAPPLQPPLPDEPLPDLEEGEEAQDQDGDGNDDGWDPMWSDEHNAWYFYNRFTQQTQWDNPRVPDATATAATRGRKGEPGAAAAAAAAARGGLAAPGLAVGAVAGGYNPAIHGDYDPNAWYAKGHAGEVDGFPAALGAVADDADADADEAENEEAIAAAAAAAAARIQQAVGGGVGMADNTVDYAYESGGDHYRPGRQQQDGRPGSAARRATNAYFDVDAAANANDGRSLKAERSGKKPTRTELKAFREKRRARKEEKRRAWLRD